MRLLKESNTKSIFNLLKEFDSASDIYMYIDHYEYKPDIIPEDVFKKDSDWTYFTIVKTEQEAKEFNYHSDYWGTDIQYQRDNVELLADLEDYIASGDKMYFTDDTGEKYYFTVTGVAIDRQYNSISHTKILIKEEDSVNESITEKLSNKKLRESEEQKPNYVMFYLNGKELGGHDLANEFEGERESARELFAYENNVKPEEIEVREVYRESESKKRYAYDIDWETDGDEEAKKELPTKVRIPEDIDKDSVADWLSDKYGWLVNSVSLEESLKEATDEEYEEYIKREKERAEEGYKDICSHITDSQREKFNGLKEMLTNEANGIMDVDGWYFATDAVYAVNNSGSGHHLNPYMDLTTSNVLLMVGENNSIEEAIKELFDEYKPDSAYSWADNFLYALDKVNLNAYQEFMDEQTMEDEMYENAVNELVSWMYDNFPDNSFYKEGTLGNGDVVYYFDVKKGNVDEIKEAVKAKFGDEVSFGTARQEYAPESREFVIICKKKKRNINESVIEVDVYTEANDESGIIKELRDEGLPQSVGVKVIEVNGPAGGNPTVHLIGKMEDIQSYLDAQGFEEGSYTILEESKKPKKEKKEDKRVVMQQGNVTCFKENDSTYYVFENESDNEVEYDNEEAAMQDFLERVGIDPNNELTESVKLNEAGEWDDYDEDNIASKNNLTDVAKYIADNVPGGYYKDARGFDAYQGPYAYVESDLTGGELWYGETDELFQLETGYGWILGDKETLVKALSDKDYLLKLVEETKKYIEANE